MAKLTKGMINHLNEVIAEYDAGFHFVFVDEPIAPKARVETKDRLDGVCWVESSIVNLTNEFRDWLDNFFKEQYEVTLIYNNTKTTIWSNDFTD